MYGGAESIPREVDPQAVGGETPGASGPSVSERTSTRIGTKADGASTEGPF